MYLVQVLSTCYNVTALGANSSGNLKFLSPSYPYDPNTFWYLDQGFSSLGVPLGYLFRHVKTGKTLAGQANGEIVFTQVETVDEWSTWTFGYTNGQAFAMRSNADSNLNLNILGGCGNSGLGLWQWGGGQKCSAAASNLRNRSSWSAISAARRRTG